MLSSLHIENIAVIKSVDIDFFSGFSGFTGETGAGKSMIIDSINLLRGGRSERGMIRTGEDHALVSALFDHIEGVSRDALCAIGVTPDEDGRLLLQRTIGADGRSSVHVNGRAVSLSLLREIGQILIQIHGQNDNRLLTEEENHIAILDGYAADGEELETYRRAYHVLCDVRREIREVSGDEGERLRLAEMLRYQIADIDSFALRTGEEEKLQQKRARLRNAERIAKQTSFAYRALKGSEKGSVSYIISRSVQAVNQLRDVLPGAGEWASRLEECLYTVEDVAEQIYDAGGEEDGDPTEELNRVEERLDAISRLCRKYGKDIPAILEFRNQAAERLEKLEVADDRLSELKKKEQLCVKEAAAAAATLHHRRAEAAERLKAEVTESLVFLDMPRVRFDVAVTLAETHGEMMFDRFGCDRVTFLISTNPGEPLAPLSKIASGGELSRIMLSLKSVISDRDGIPTVIYDEVDTGVSGKTARKIGLKLKNTGRQCQVICVTHSAQIASLADQQYLIEKHESDGRAQTSVRMLDREGRVEEIARILGGISVTDAQRSAALDMLEGK